MSPDVSKKGESEFSSGNPPGSLLRGNFACGVLVVDAQGRIAACTVEAAELLHTAVAQLENLPIHSLPPPFPKLIRDAAKSGRPATKVNISLKSPRGSAFDLSASILPVKSAETSLVIIVLNHSGSVPVFEQNMRRLDRLASLGTLSASMAHEIKNGMVAIKTFIDLLAQKGHDTELTEVVDRELQRINAIVSQMLRFAAPKAASYKTVHVHELLDHSLRLLHHQISEKLISLQRQYNAPTDAIRGDDAQLQQALMNLLLNALEAMDTNGVLTVVTDVKEEKKGLQMLSVQIRDTGVGILPENLGRLFEPFFTTKKNGTGLGLAISQRIVHEHNGIIQMESEINRGSTFSLVLPMVS